MADDQGNGNAARVSGIATADRSHVPQRRRAAFAACGAVLAGLLAVAAPAAAQERFSLYVPSPQSVAEAMAKMANVGKSDVVVDLGSGDGRIVTTAARLHGARGFGVEINPELVELASSLAKKSGVGDRVSFIHQNVFDTDLRKATVVNMYLFPELMRLLRPKLLNELQPGTRIVSHDFGLGTWEPDEQLTFFAPDKFGGAGADARISLWIVPAKIDGYWNWSLPVGGQSMAYASIVEQRFQVGEGIVRVGNRRGTFSDLRLRGDQISFGLRMTLDPGVSVMHEFRGTVKGGTIEGTARVTADGGKTVELPWRATRSTSTTYFQPTGLAAK
ncbi:MAG: class I SAM-dependent methyltransferase [Burkholderiales bacterium]|nr:class I SAM-dependent methyltransferase [Burkholderiales bacterium]